MKEENGFFDENREENRIVTIDITTKWIYNQIQGKDKRGILCRFQAVLQ